MVVNGEGIRQSPISMNLYLLADLEKISKYNPYIFQAAELVNESIYLIFSEINTYKTDYIDNSS